jgi:hypothetical protein
MPERTTDSSGKSLDTAVGMVVAYRGGTGTGAAIDDPRRFEAMTARHALSSPGRARSSR